MRRRRGGHPDRLHGDAGHGRLLGALGLGRGADVGDADAHVYRAALRVLSREGTRHVTVDKIAAEAGSLVVEASDLTRFVREGNTRGLFENRAVVSVLSGEPEYLEPLGADAPTGWIVTGYPWYAIDTPANTAFVEAYKKRYNETPKVGSVVGYASLMSIAEGLKAAGSVDTEKLVDAFAGLKVDTPYGQIHYRKIDHQSTMGVYVGTTAVEDGKGVMKDFAYIDGARLQPPDEQVRKMRPAP